MRTTSGEIDRLDRLDDVSERTRLTRGLDLRLVAVAREDHDRDLRILLAEPLQAGEAVELGHPQVEQHDVRLRLANRRNDLAADRDLADDLEILRVRESAPDRGQHEPMVVRYEYSKCVQPPQSLLWALRGRIALETIVHSG